MPTPPPPASTLQIIHTTSIAAVLARLNLKISINNILKDIQEEDTRYSKLAILCRGKSGLILHPNSDNERSQSQIHSLLLASPSLTLPNPPMPIKQLNVATFY